MAIKGLIFDKDGTLFDFQSSWGPWFYDLLKELTEGQGERLFRSAELCKFNLSSKTFFPNSPFVSGSTDELISVIRPFTNKYPGEELSSFILKKSLTVKQLPVTNLVYLFQILKDKGFKMGLATNDYVTPAIIQLKTSNIAQMFEFIAGCDSGFGSKPEAGQLFAFAKKLNLLPEEVIMIGDSKVDMIAGKLAGMKTVAVLTGVALETDLEQFADAVLKNISELPLFLAK